MHSPILKIINSVQVLWIDPLPAFSARYLVENITYWKQYTVVSPAEARGQIIQFRHDDTVYRKVKLLAHLKKDWWRSEYNTSFLADAKLWNKWKLKHICII